MNTLRHDIEQIAAEIAIIAPEQSHRLRFLAVRAGRNEVALDEIYQDARESAELAERDTRARLALVHALDIALDALDKAEGRM